MKKPEEIVSARKMPLERGKWSNLLEQGSNIAVIDPDIVEQFPDSTSVNRALRMYLRMKEQFEALQESPEDSLAGRKTPLPFDPRNGRKPDQIAVAK